jgi:hypothetical protein
MAANEKGVFEMVVNPCFLWFKERKLEQDFLSHSRRLLLQHDKQFLWFNVIMSAMLVAHAHKLAFDLRIALVYHVTPLAPGILAHIYGPYAPSYRWRHSITIASRLYVSLTLGIYYAKVLDYTAYVARPSMMCLDTLTTTCTLSLLYASLSSLLPLTLQVPVSICEAVIFMSASSNLVYESPMLANMSRGALILFGVDALGLEGAPAIPPARLSSLEILQDAIVASTVACAVVYSIEYKARAAFYCCATPAAHSSQPKQLLAAPCCSTRQHNLVAALNRQEGHSAGGPSQQQPVQLTGDDLIALIAQHTAAQAAPSSLAREARGVPGR